jgi:hypothetical protein
MFPELAERQLQLLIEECAEHNIPRDRVELIVKEAMGRRGIHIGLNSRILKLQIEHDHEAYGYSLRTGVGTGLPLECVESIQPISTVDANALDIGLRKQ